MQTEEVTYTITPADLDADIRRSFETSYNHGLQLRIPFLSTFMSSGLSRHTHNYTDKVHATGRGRLLLVGAL